MPPPAQMCLEYISEMAAHANKGSPWVGGEASEMSGDRKRETEKAAAEGHGERLGGAASQL